MSPGSKAGLQARGLDGSCRGKKFCIAHGSRECRVALFGEKSRSRRASTELHKLASFAQGRAIVADDVELLVSRQDESHVFSFIDTLLAGDGATARRMTAHLLAQKDSSAVGIIVLLQNQFRAFCILKDLCATGTSDADAAAKLSWNPKRVWVVKRNSSASPWSDCWRPTDF